MPVLHIGDAAADRLVADGRTRVALLGSRFTMTEPFIRNRLEARGITLVPIEPLWMQEVDRIIFEELAAGRVVRDSQRKLKTLITELAKQKVQAVVLGCTELVLAVDVRANVIPVYDTTAIHARAAVDWMLAEEEAGARGRLTRLALDAPPSAYLRCVTKADRPDHPARRRSFQRGSGDLCRARRRVSPTWKRASPRSARCGRRCRRGPGVYRMQDARGDVLYVGKARTLKSRVSNYTQVARLPKRLQRMVSQTRSMTIVTTRTEAEALLLEAQLIKRFRPAYNVLLRDDKSFPFIMLREDHEFPRIQKHRGARRIKKAHYYGPFASAGSVTRTLNALQKLFLLRSCSDSFFANRSRPCLLYQIKRCSAPCVGRIGEQEYGELVGEAKEFLAGKSTGRAVAAVAIDGRGGGTPGL